VNDAYDPDTDASGGDALGPSAASAASAAAAGPPAARRLARGQQLPRRHSPQNVCFRSVSARPRSARNFIIPLSPLEPSSSKKALAVSLVVRARAVHEILDVANFPHAFWQVIRPIQPGEEVRKHRLGWGLSLS